MQRSKVNSQTNSEFYTLHINIKIVSSMFALFRCNVEPRYTYM